MERNFLELEKVWLSSTGLLNISASGADAGSESLRLELNAFVGRDARLDSAQCGVASRKCRITLYDNDREIWSGTLVRSDGEWLIHRKAGDDDPAWRLNVHTVRPGEGVLVHQPGRILRFRIVSVHTPVGSRGLE